MMAWRISLVLVACSSPPAAVPDSGEPPPHMVDAAPDAPSLHDGFTLVKDWDFGTNGNIGDIAAMTAEFDYHDQFHTIANGANYGSLTVAPDAASAITDATHGAQPIDPSVRKFTADSLQTFLVPLNGATTVDPMKANVGNGSFTSKFRLPASRTQDVLWETRVRYVTPPYFWFAIWAAGNKWNHGAEEDVVESFGYDNGGGNTNYDGRYWHSNSVGGVDADGYASWGGSMSAHGVASFDASQYHVWSWLYRLDDTYTVYVDGDAVNTGTLHWTDGATTAGEPIDMVFLFDAGWGHTQVASVDHTLPAVMLADAVYEWDYSRIYLR